MIIHMKNKTNRIFLYLCIFYLLHYISMGVYSPYLNVYYERLGFSGSEFGLINSLGLLFAMGMAPVWGAISDRTRNTKGVIAFLFLATGFTMIIWVQQRSFLPVLILAIAVSMFRSSIDSLSDSVSIAFTTQNNKDYSIIRSMGSLGYLLGSFVIANILFSFGFQGPYVYVVLICAILGAFFILQVPRTQPKQKEKSDFKKNIKALLKNKDYLFILGMMILTTMTTDSFVNYTGNHLIHTLHQNDTMIGIFSCAMVLPEVLIVMNGNRLFRKLGTKKMYLIACAGQLIRTLVYTCTQNMPLFLLASTLHGLTITVGTVGNVSFINKKVEGHMLATAMSLYSSLYIIGSAILSQVFGFVYQYFSSYGIYMIASCASLLALICVWRTKRFDE